MQVDWTGLRHLFSLVSPPHLAEAAWSVCGGSITAPKRWWQPCLIPPAMPSLWSHRAGLSAVDPRPRLHNRGEPPPPLLPPCPCPLPLLLCPCSCAPAPVPLLLCPCPCTSCAAPSLCLRPPNDPTQQPSATHRTPRQGLFSNTMALITSDCVAMRLPEHQMALITSVVVRWARAPTRSRPRSTRKRTSTSSASRSPPPRSAHSASHHPRTACPVRGRRTGAAHRAQRTGAAHRRSRLRRSRLRGAWCAGASHQCAGQSPTSRTSRTRSMTHRSRMHRSTMHRSVLQATSCRRKGRQGGGGPADPSVRPPDGPWPRVEATRGR